MAGERGTQQVASLPHFPRSSALARRAKYPRRLGAWRPKAGGSQLVATVSRGRASGRLTRSARRHGDTEEIESWFTCTAGTRCLIPRLCMEVRVARSRRSAPLPGPLGRNEVRPSRFRTPRAEGGAGTSRAGLVGGGEGACRVLVVDEVSNETVRKPASNSISVSPCLRALRVDRPEARSRRGATLPGGRSRGLATRRLADVPRRGRRGYFARRAGGRWGGRIPGFPWTRC